MFRKWATGACRIRAGAFHRVQLPHRRCPIAVAASDQNGASAEDGAELPASGNGMPAVDTNGVPIVEGR